jgi:hypothetical protein
MKTIIFIVSVLLVSCTERIQKNETGILKIQKDSISSIQNCENEISNGPILNVNSLKLRFDTIGFKIPDFTEQYKLESDTIGISEKMGDSYYYHDNIEKLIIHLFKLDSRNHSMTVSLKQISYLNESDADTVFKRLLFLGSAPFDEIEKLGYIPGPGLTYTNDFVIQKRNEIYWLNSSCKYSKFNHNKFVSALLEELQMTESYMAIQCYCGGDCKLINNAP